jgi:hypothetical protein
VVVVVVVVVVVLFVTMEQFIGQSATENKGWNILEKPYCGCGH